MTITTVHTVYELCVLTRLRGCGEFALTELFDELERMQAVGRYERELRRARAIVGTERNMCTKEGGEVRGVVDRVAVILAQRTTDGAWITKPTVVKADEGDGELVEVVTSGGRE